jgi:hypothetical protein
MDATKQDGDCHMDGDKASAVEATKEADDGQNRQRSTIAFPYVDLNAAIELAQAIHGNVGSSGDCDDTQLAVWTNQSTKSSTFRIQLSGARMFGLMATDGAGRHRLTDLGRSIVDPSQARESRVRAFMMVPLFKAIYESNKGGVLPPTAALAREMVGLGVAEKTKDRARQVFERSAEQAGFFEAGRNRLVMPGIVVGREQPREEGARATAGEVGSGGNGGGGKDPLIAALIQKLPKAGPWAAEDRVTWLQMIAMAFQMHYGTTDPIEITTKKQG